MKLSRSFIKLPYLFDVGRLSAEVNQFGPDEWHEHPNRFSGNSAIRLVSRDGEENDDVIGSMLPTQSLERCPYIQQIIESFSVVVSRSRLMRLTPGSVVPQHSDINYHWHDKVRIHIPVVTDPAVLFYCGEDVVHMAAGEAWIFDNWRLHRVENGSAITRIHLVIDTVGSADFWRMVESVDMNGADFSSSKIRSLAYRYSTSYRIVTEADSGQCLLAPDELSHLCRDLIEDISCAADSDTAGLVCNRFSRAIVDLQRDWRGLYSRYGGNPGSIAPFHDLLNKVWADVDSIRPDVVMRDNGVLAKNVLRARVLQSALRRRVLDTPAPNSKNVLRTLPEPRFEEPVFIVSAPRSGSTLLFETLAQHPDFKTVGGESHDIFERVAGFNPATGVVPDNRLTEDHATQDCTEIIHKAFWNTLRSADSSHFIPALGQSIRLLEKTPKNALRIPFIRKIFPDAKFIFLHREPYANVASIIEAWLSGRWMTYRSLPGRNAPWSLLLPPDWPAVHQGSLPSIAAFQWRSANEHIINDLMKVAEDRVMPVGYEELIADPAGVVARIFSFAGLTLPEKLWPALDKELPLSRYTLTPPQKDKWRKHETSILPFAHSLSETYERVNRFSNHLLKS